MASGSMLVASTHTLSFGLADDGGVDLFRLLVLCPNWHVREDLTHSCAGSRFFTQDLYCFFTFVIFDDFFFVFGINFAFAIGRIMVLVECSYMSISCPGL